VRLISQHGTQRQADSCNLFRFAEPSPQALQLQQAQVPRAYSLTRARGLLLLTGDRVVDGLYAPPPLAGTVRTLGHGPLKKILLTLSTWAEFIRLSDIGWVQQPAARLRCNNRSAANRGEQR